MKQDFQNKKKDLLEPIKSRIITLGDIDNYNSNEVIESIYEINDLDSRKKTNIKPIQLIINSPGGNVYDGFAIIDAINNSKIPIHTICLGQALSAALPIFLSGHVRYGGKLSTYMYHSIWYEVNATISQHKDELIEANRMAEMFDSIVINRSLLSKDILDNIKDRNKDKYFSVNEALDLGMVDIIL